MRALLILIAMLMVEVTAVFAAEFVKQATAGVTTRQIDGPIDHNVSVPLQSWSVC